MYPTTKECMPELETIKHSSGDLIIPIILDPAVAAQVWVIAERWGNMRLAETVSDLLLVGLISVNSTASTT